MINQPSWRFRCPDCGFGDVEHGHLLTVEEIYCVVCLQEERRYVRLHRWEDAEADVQKA